MKASNILYTILAAALLVSCSMTKGIPEDDQLFTGLTKIAYASEPKLQDETYSKHLATTKEELEAALATQPNGSLFGSSYYTVPWSWHLWVYNKYSGKESGFAKWMVKSFGKPPVLMSKVNPALRASVARSVLQNNGFFRGNVTYETIPQKNPKKCKIGYTVEFDSLYTLDSVSYVNFPAPMQSLIDSTSSERLIKSGAPFSIANLDGERTRISNLMRNNGYFYCHRRESTTALPAGQRTARRSLPQMVYRQYQCQLPQDRSRAAQRLHPPTSSHDPLQRQEITHPTRCRTQGPPTAPAPGIQL